MNYAGFVSLDFAEYFEPEAGICTAREFTDELCAWAGRTGRDLVILEEGMEPLVQLDGAQYRCRLAEPGLAAQKNTLWQALLRRGITHSVGGFLGYKWVYLYRQ